MYLLSVVSSGVAGVHAPAFVERSLASFTLSSSARVSPGFTPRPSLSVLPRGRLPGAGRVSPGFTPRPSLSGAPGHRIGEGAACVAGVHAPAFVERTTRVSTPPAPSCVAGVHAPAFVERVGAPRWPRPACRVSPGFTPRPSLSVQAVRLEPPRLLVCRRGSRPGLR